MRTISEQDIKGLKRDKVGVFNKKGGKVYPKYQKKEDPGRDLKNIADTIKKNDDLIGEIKNLFYDINQRLALMDLSKNTDPGPKQKSHKVRRDSKGLISEIIAKELCS